MMRLRINQLWAIGAISLVLGCQSQSKEEPLHSDLDLAAWVDPYIGSGGHGHVFVGANVPFGAVQLGPVNLTEGWDWCSGYHISDSTIIGFAHTHLSGTGIGDLGDILMMPFVGEVQVTKGKPEQPETGYFSYFSHEQETVEPGYYAVELDRYQVKAEMTASDRVGFHRYTFPDSDSAQILINLKQGIGWDQPVETHVRWENDTTVSGYRFSKGWAEDQKIFFAAVFSQPIKGFQVYDLNERAVGNAYTGKAVKAALGFAMEEKGAIKVKVGISPVSRENALENIQVEIPHWDFERTKKEARQAWNRELNKVEVELEKESDYQKFYTALYHTMMAPSTFHDVNGEYRGADGQVRKDTSFTNLTTFSLWDTYRGANPLYTIFQQDRVKDMIQSMLKIYEQQGKLPVWHLMGNETNTMPGYSAVPIVVDAFLKGVPMDAELAFEAVKASAMRDESGLDKVKELGYIPADSEVESVSKGLEYAISDACIALMAKELGKEKDYQYFWERSQNYKKYYDREVGFMRGRLSDASWRTPFSPFTSIHMKGDFTEGNAWQYTWLVPHDVEGLVELLGGKQAFISKLDELFEVEGDMGEEASNDITGLIGQYAHGNEPSHHVTYLYNLVGQPHKTAEKVRYILDELYTNQPDGLSGNEDVGQMSAWYVLSALGFYPVHPANGEYVWGSPLVNKATIRMDNGKTLELEVDNNSSENIYIQQITFNGKPYSTTTLFHRDVVNGGKIVVEMGRKPVK